jgi:hypothetical protein
MMLKYAKFKPTQKSTGIMRRSLLARRPCFSLNQYDHKRLTPRKEASNQYTVQINQKAKNPKEGKPSNPTAVTWRCHRMIALT